MGHRRGWPHYGPVAAEITARTGKNPSEHYRELTVEFGPLADVTVERMSGVLQDDLLMLLTTQGSSASPNNLQLATT